MAKQAGEELAVKLTDDQRKTLGSRLLSQITESRAKMKGVLDKVRDWNALYESDLPTKDTPWPGCANLNIPLIQSHVDTIHAHVNDTMLGVDPCVGVLPPAGMSDPGIKTKAQAVESFLQYVFDEVMDFPQTADQWNLLALKEPAAVAQVDWREDYRTVKQRVPVTDEMGQPVPDEMGQPLTKIEETQEPKYRGPKVQLCDLANLVVYPPTAETVDEAAILGHQYRLSRDGVIRRQKQGLWDTKACDAILEGAGTTEASRQDDDDNTREQDGIEGLERSDSFEEFWFYQVLAGYDANGDGLEEDCVFTLEKDSGIIVRATRFPYHHGRRNYIAQRAFPRVRRFLGRCMPQILEGVQREINAVHNQRVDAVTIAMSKPFKALESWAGEGDALRLFPGSITRMNTPDELTELDISPAVPGVDVEEMTRDWGERATGQNDVSLGKGTEQKKTLGEVQLVASKGGVRIADIIRRLNTGIVELAEQVIGLYYQFGDEQEIQALTQGKLTLSDFSIPWRFVAKGTMGAADKQAQQATSLALYDKLIQNPLIMQSPSRIHRLTSDVLQSFDRTDIDPYIGTEEEAKQLEEAIQQQQMMQAQAEQEMAMQQQAMAQQQMAGDAEQRQFDREGQMADRQMAQERQGFDMMMGQQQMMDENQRKQMELALKERQLNGGAGAMGGNRRPVGAGRK